MKNLPAPSLLSRLARTALPAAPLALAAIPSAHAAIIYTNPTDTTTTGTSILYLDMGASGAGGSISGNANIDADFALLSFSAGKPVLYGLVSSSHGFSATGNLEKNFQLNDTIGGTADLSAGFINYLGANDANWAAGTKGYLGVQFDAVTAGTVYGWIQVSYNSDLSLTVYDFAYQSDGSAIAAGATSVPEPAATTALAALLAGSAALYAKRRQPKQSA